MFVPDKPVQPSRMFVGKVDTRGRIRKTLFLRRDQMWVLVNQRLHFLLSTMYSPLLPAAIRPNDNVSSVGVTLACYQQAGSGRKYVGVSGKWRR